MAGPMIVEASEPTLISRAPISKTSFQQDVLDCFSFLKRGERHSPPTTNSIASGSNRRLFLKPILHRHHNTMDPCIDAVPYRWPHDSSFDPKTTALVIIDMQKDFCSPDGYLQYQGYDISATRAIIPKLQTLLSSFREKGFTIYHTREGHRPDLSTLSSREHARSRNNETGKGIGDLGPIGRLLIRGEKGHDIIPELTPLPNENIIDKPGRSAFQHTDFKLILNIKGIKNLVICGVTTDVCVSSTMREANDNNFDCVIVEDATAASDPKLHKSALESVKMEGGIFGAVSSTAKILAALEGGKEGREELFVDFSGMDGTNSSVPAKQTVFVTPDKTS